VLKFKGADCDKEVSRKCQTCLGTAGEIVRPGCKLPSPEQEELAVSTKSTDSKSSKSHSKHPTKKSHEHVDSSPKDAKCSSVKQKSKSSQDSSNSGSSSSSASTSSLKTKGVVPRVDDEDEFYSLSGQSDLDEKVVNVTSGGRSEKERSETIMKESVKIKEETETSPGSSPSTKTSHTSLKIPRSSESLPVTMTPAPVGSSSRKCSSSTDQKPSTVTPTTSGQQRSLSTNDAITFAKNSSDDSSQSGLDEDGKESLKLPKGLSDALSAFFTPSGRKRSCTLKKDKESEDEKDKEVSPKDKTSAAGPSTSSPKKPASVKSRKTASAPATITEDSADSSMISPSVHATVTKAANKEVKVSERKAVNVEKTPSISEDSTKIPKSESKIRPDQSPSFRKGTLKSYLLETTDKVKGQLGQPKEIKKRTPSRSKSPDKKLEAITSDETSKQPASESETSSLKSSVPSHQKRKGRPPTKNPSQTQITEYFGASPVRAQITTGGKQQQQSRNASPQAHSSKSQSEPLRKRGRPPKRKLEDANEDEESDDEGASAAEDSMAPSSVSQSSAKKKARTSSSNLPGMDKIVATFSGEVVRRTTPPLESSSSSLSAKERGRGRPPKKSKQFSSQPDIPEEVEKSKEKSHGKSPVGKKSTRSDSASSVSLSPKRHTAVASDSLAVPIAETPKRNRSKGRVEEIKTPSARKVQAASPSPSRKAKSADGSKTSDRKSSSPVKPVGQKAKGGLASPSAPVGELLFLDPFEVKKTSGPGSSVSSGSLSPTGAVRLDCGKVAALVKERAKVELLAQSRRKSVSPVKLGEKNKTSTPSKSPGSKMSHLVAPPSSSSSQPPKSAKKPKKQHLLQQLVTDLLIPSATPGDSCTEVTPSGRPRRAVTTKQIQQQSSSQQGESSSKVEGSTSKKGTKDSAVGDSKKKKKEDGSATPVVSGRSSVKGRALSLASVSPQKDKKFGDKDAMRKYLKKKALAQNAKTASSVKQTTSPVTPVAAVFGKKGKKAAAPTPNVLQPKAKNGASASKVPEAEEEEEEEIRPTDERAIKAGLLPGTVLPDDITDEDIEMYRKAQAKANEVWILF